MRILRALSLTVLATASLFAWREVAQAQVSQPVAIVYSLAGEATVALPGAGSRPLRLFERLPANAAVEVGAASRLALAFFNGRRYQLGERARVTVGPRDLASQTGPVQPLRQVPPLPGLAPIAKGDQPGSRAGAVRIRTERITGLYPHGGTATLSDATTLRFAGVDGGAMYGVEVHDRQGNTIFEVETTATAIALPPSILRPGSRYDWTVRTIERAGPVAQGRASFESLATDLAQAREALREALAGERDGASLALLAEVDWSLGLLAESRDGLRTAVRASPEDSRLAADLAQREQRLTYLQSP